MAGSEPGVVVTVSGEVDGLVVGEVVAGAVDGVVVGGVGAQFGSFTTGPAMRNDGLMCPTVSWPPG